ncbi:hypothetical protein Psuf_061070 [Phytohabitans suffuscus]|uniref:Transposase IS701-like DDE domain-containing protein n=2 Tax=Phytohabitans suffuscus TaxID=624315 RepID=A0A6F8YRR6_9ACTN|nr:hypothetical protein Psuf_061070 [Phytohabitans suffuscus]
MVAQPGRRTITGMLTAAGMAGVWHHSRAYWFFGKACWCVDTLGMAVLGLIVRRLLPAGSPLVVAVDDTLFHRSGRKVHGTAWFHDDAAKGAEEQPGRLGQQLDRARCDRQPAVP